MKRWASLSVAHPCFPQHSCWHTTWFLGVLFCIEVHRQQLSRLAFTTACVVGLGSCHCVFGRRPSSDSRKKKVSTRICARCSAPRVRESTGYAHKTKPTGGGGFSSSCPCRARLGGGPWPRPLVLSVARAWAKATRPRGHTHGRCVYRPQIRSVCGNAPPSTPTSPCLSLSLRSHLPHAPYCNAVVRWLPPSPYFPVFFLPPMPHAPPPFRRQPSAIEVSGRGMQRPCGSLPPLSPNPPTGRFGGAGGSSLPSVASCAAHHRPSARENGTGSVPCTHTQGHHTSSFLQHAPRAFAPCPLARPPPRTRVCAGADRP